MSHIILIIAVAHLVYCPFTKVEESFNLQAMHDILYHKWNLSQYDHLEFPGVVPRTFIGPLFISILVSPIVFLFQLFDVSKFWAQYIVRIALGGCVIASLHVLLRTLLKTFGHNWVQWFIAITVTQSHFMFYLSRPLPNIFALPLVLLALNSWLRSDSKQFIFFSGAAIIVFRAELALFLGLFLAYDLFYKRITIKRFFQLAVPVGIGFLLLSVVVDSIFWNRPLWPEGEVLWFNVILNRSSDYGTSPFLWYFYSALPRGMAASILLVPLGLYFDERVRKLFLPAIIFVLLYSFLPHKELRFIIYVYPFLNAAAATACHRIWENRNKSPLYHLLSLGVCGHLTVNVLFTLFLLSISGTNYPGGTAISHFHRLAKDEPNVNVHISNLAAQTGVSRFTEVNANWTYSKVENLTANTPEIYQYTHLIAEAKSKFSPNLKPYSATHDVIDTIEAFHQLSFNYFTIPPVKIRTKPVLFILRRKDDYLDVLQMRGYSDNFDEQIVNHLGSQEELVVQEDVRTRSIDQEGVHFDQKIGTSPNILDSVVEKSLTYENVKVAAENQMFPNENKTSSEESSQEKTSKVNVSQKTSRKSEELQSGNQGRDSLKKGNDMEKRDIEKATYKTLALLQTSEKVKMVRTDDGEFVKQKNNKKVNNNNGDSEGRQTVKQNIKKLIQKYRRKKLGNGDVAVAEPKSVHTKDAIKKIIEEEKIKQAEEEVEKIEQQIFEIIETNPNIVHKNLIKVKLHETITGELGNIANAIATKRQTRKTEAQKKITVDSQTREENILGKPKPISRKTNVAIKLEKESVHNSINPESAVDFYEPSLHNEDNDLQDVSHENKKLRDVEESATHVNRLPAETHDPDFENFPQLSERFLEASKKIEDIMKIIDEIVDTMEMTEESEEF